MNLFSLWYVDEEYLNSLYNQIFGNITQIRISEEKNSNNESILGLDIGKIINSFKFPINLSLKTRYEIGKNVIEEKIIDPSVEYKIQKVQDDDNVKNVKFKSISIIFGKICLITYLEKLVGVFAISVHFKNTENISDRSF